MAAKLVRMVTYFEGLLTIKSYKVLITNVTIKNNYISSTTVPMTTKLGRMVAYLDRLLPTKSYDSLIT